MTKNIILLKVYLMAGTFTFSGGMAMLPLIENELSEKRDLISKEDLHEYTTLSQVFPGVIALTNACFVGRKVNGWSGMFFAGFGAILPAYLLMSLATFFYQFIPASGPMFQALVAVRATSASFLFVACYSLTQFNIHNKRALMLALLAFTLTFFQIISAPFLIILGIAGGIISKLSKERKNK